VAHAQVSNQQHRHHETGSSPPIPPLEGRGGGTTTSITSTTNNFNNNNKLQQQQQLSGSEENQDPKQHLALGSASELIKASRQQPTRVAFVLGLTATRDWRWEGVVWQGRLYLEVPTRLVQTGSKEGFVALLEYAEEELHCTQVVLALSKDRQDRADVVRTFMFLGFSVLPPGHQLVPANSNNLFLACSLE